MENSARLWISDHEAVNCNPGVTRVFDLSATPSFLNGSGYIECILFTWTTRCRQ
jgi:type III restriction enzyme